MRIVGRSTLLLAFFAIPALGTAETNAVLRTIADVRALTDAEFAEQRPVELEGHVVAAMYGTGRILEDKTGRFFVDTRTANMSPAAGDVIHLTGETFLHVKLRQESVHALHIDVVGHRPTNEPQITDAKTISSGTIDFLPVRLRGFISEVFEDEINAKWNYLVLQSDGSPVYVAVPNAADDNRPLSGFVDADVELTGIVMPHYCAQRMFIGPHLELWSPKCIRVIRPAAADPFLSPRLEDIIHVSPGVVAQMRRRTAEGTVLAVWRSNRLLMKEGGGRLVGVELTGKGRTPSCGIRIQVVGFPETDLFHLNLTRAMWKPAEGAAPAEKSPSAPISVTAAQILNDESSNKRINPDYHGKVIRLSGLVRSLMGHGDADGRISLDCDGFLVPVDLNANPSAAHELEIGCRIEATGVCILEADNWSPNRLFPLLGGFTLVPRTPSDIRIISRPPWWTPGRLLVVISSLIAALLGIFIWNRILNRLVERRGRELLKSEIDKAGAELRIDERTRLAVDLHDSIAQELASVSLQLATSVSAREVDPDASAEHVATAMRMLKSCQTDLRHRIWDLRSEALDNADFEEAIRSTLKPVGGETNIAIRFAVPRQKISDATANAILNVIRELVSNAIRHGKARTIQVAGARTGRSLMFSVQDDGCGFAPDSVPGPEQGHFGLKGIRERVKRLGGTFTVESAAGTGTRAVITLALNHEETNP